jgi:hypothetical protein
MPKDSRSDGPEEVLVCVWCGAGVLPYEVQQGKHPVCAKCVRLLLDAGLSDEEIYGSEREDTRRE